MTTYPEYQKQLASALISCVTQAQQTIKKQRVAAMRAETGTDTATLVNQLISGMPYYGDMGMENIHRTALANLMEVNLPNNGIAPHPDVSGPWYAYYRSTYSYNGHYSGYRDAFFSGVGQSSLAGSILSQATAADGKLNGAWWGNFGVAILTDAVRQKVSVSLDTGKLSGEINNENIAFRPGLAASYLAVLTNGFSQTANVFNEIKAGHQLQEAATVLDQAIGNGRFTANINESISMGGDSSNAATWFLYNLWVMLKALGLSDIDGAIHRYQKAGLQVPAEVQAGNWWNGTYCSWFPALSGADVMAQASGTITASMPEQEMTVYPSTGGMPVMPVTCNVSEKNGYSQSFTQWGGLNRFVPHSSGSCFGAGTLVLMADGSAKPIEAVEIGDEIHTNLGPRKVSLKEKPPRGTRPLYRVNDLKLQTTGGHPFRRAGQQGAKYGAIEPWTLIDGVPTITADGVTHLNKGVELMAIRDMKPASVIVEYLYQQSVGKGDDTSEPVYDLLVENWEKERSVYFVGGPEVFLGVEPESIDPTQSMAVTNGLITALETATPASRMQLGNPHFEIPTLLKDIDFDQLLERARKASRVYFGGKSLPETSKAGPDCLIQQGDWDPHASAMEYYVTRSFGRALRTEAANGWRIAHRGNPAGDRLVIGVFDLELVDEPLPADLSPQLGLCLRSIRYDGLQTPSVLSLSSKRKEIWNLRLDQCVDLGRMADVTSGAVVEGYLRVAEGQFARFRSAIDPDMVCQPRHDVYLYHPDGEMRGRLAIDMRRLSAEQIEDEAEYRNEWSPKQELQFASCLGRQLGLQLVTLLDAYASI